VTCIANLSNINKVARIFLTCQPCYHGHLSAEFLFHPFFSAQNNLDAIFPFLSVFFHAGALSLAAAGNSENSVSSGLGASLGASLERPGTSLRGGGRVAMTVLRPQQQKAATALPQLAMPQQGQEAQAGPERSPRRSLLGVKNVSSEHAFLLHCHCVLTVYEVSAIC